MSKNISDIFISDLCDNICFDQNCALPDDFCAQPNDLQDRWEYSWMDNEVEDSDDEWGWGGCCWWWCGSEGKRKRFATVDQERSERALCGIWLHHNPHHYHHHHHHHHPWYYNSNNPHYKYNLYYRDSDQDDDDDMIMIMIMKIIMIMIMAIYRQAYLWQ